MSDFVCSPIRVGRLVHRLLIGLIAISSFAATASAQTTVTLSTPGTHINADLTIQGGAYGWVDFSNDDSLATKVSTESYTRRIMLKFDTQNYIPANAVIQSARLYLVLKKAENSESRPLTAYYVNRSFHKGQANWYYYAYGQAWSTPGGDLGSSFGTTYVGDSVGSAYEFDLTDMVQRTVNGEFGSRYTRVALVDTGGWSDGNYREFHSTRAWDSSVRPRLVITYGGSSSSSSGGTTTTSPSPSTAPESSGGSTLRVMQWNIHKTKGTDGACNPDRIANTIAEQNVDVVSLNEVNFYSGSCAWSFDMGEKLRALVQQKTGVTWYRQNTDGGSDGVGNVLLSKYRPAAQDATSLSYDRGVAAMTIAVNGRYVNLFSTHVDYANSWYRTTQMNQAISYMGNFSGPKIMMGDFNTWPGTSDYYIMAQPYEDAWVAAQNSGTGWAFNGTGATHGDSRFDYIFYSRNSGLSLVRVNVPDTEVWGVYPSDHHPVIAEFRVN